MTRLTFRKRAVGLWLSLAASYLFTATVASTQNAPYVPPIKPTFSEAVAFDVSPPLRTLSRVAPPFPYYRDGLFEIRPEWGREPEDHGYSSDGAIQFSRPIRNLVPSPLVNFEGLSNHDNFNVLGGRVNPPDPSGTVGPNHYIEEINLVYAIYDKQGNKLAGPFDLGSLWQNFSITDCAGESGDPVTLYDRFSDRWILSQFTSAGPNYWNCVAISTTGDPTGLLSVRIRGGTVLSGLSEVRHMERCLHPDVARLRERWQLRHQPVWAR